VYRLPADGRDTGDPTADGTRRTIAVVAVDTLPDALEVDLDASVEDARITAESPGIVEIAVTNDGTERHFGIGPGSRCGPFNREHGASSPPGLWLEIPERPGYAHPFNTLTRPPDRWSFDVSPDRNRTFLSDECGGRQFAPGETVTYRYQVWDDYTVAGYLEPGAYTFRRTLAVGTTQAKWGFDLAVARPTES
jgi:hypothetical protein